MVGLKAPAPATGAEAIRASRSNTARLLEISLEISNCGRRVGLWPASMICRPSGEMLPGITALVTKRPALGMVISNTASIELLVRSMPTIA